MRATGKRTVPLPPDGNFWGFPDQPRGPSMPCGGLGALSSLRRDGLEEIQFTSLKAPKSLRPLLRLHSNRHRHDGQAHECQPANFLKGAQQQHHSASVLNQAVLFSLSEQRYAVGTVMTLRLRGLDVQIFFSCYVPPFLLNFLHDSSTRSRHLATRVARGALHWQRERWAACVLHLAQYRSHHVSLVKGQVNEDRQQK
jgi:hypothetical protein